MQYLVRWTEEGTSRSGEVTVDTLQQVREYLEDQSYCESLIETVLEERSYVGTFDVVTVEEI